MNFLRTTSIFVGILVALSGAQSIPNAGFENWTALEYEEPESFWTPNSETVPRYGQTVVTKTTDAHSGTYAIQLDTKELEGDTTAAIIMKGIIGEEVIGGASISGAPSALTGYYKCNIPAGDSALICAVFTKNGDVVNTDWMENVLKLHGEISEYTQFSIPFSLSQTPDSVAVVALSSNLLTSNGIPGSMLQLDDLVFEEIDEQPADFNGGFENWQTVSYLKLDGWNVDGDSVARTSDAYANNYAVRLVTTSDDDSEVNASSISLGVYDHAQQTQVGGVPFTGQTDTLCGWYKYTAVEQDTAAAWIQVRKGGVDIHYQGIDLMPASDYTYFEIPFSIDQQPDSLIVGVVSSKHWDSGIAGSELIVDNIRLKSQGEVSTGRRDTQQRNSNALVAVSHAPGSDKLRIRVHGNTNGTLTLRLFDCRGRIVYARYVTGHNHLVDLAPYAKGAYMLQVITPANITTVRLVR